MKPRFKQYGFEKLEIWRIGMEIISEIYRITKGFPKDELFSLTNQLKRAGTSIVLNIAEGTGQPTRKSFALYLERAKASTLECVACLKIAIQEGFTSQPKIEKLEDLLEAEYFKIIAFNKKLKP